MQVIRRSKLLKITTLVLSSVLLATASASVYNLMYGDATVTAYAAKLYFDSTGAADATAAGTVVGTNHTSVMFTSLSGWPNATRVYTETAFLKANSSFTGCVITAPQVTDSNVNTLKMTLYDGSTQKAQLNLLNANPTTGTFDISSGDSWRIQWEIQWKPGVTADHYVTTTLTLNVPNEGASE